MALRLGIAWNMCLRCKGGRAKQFMKMRVPMAHLNETQLRLTMYGLESTTVEQADHYKTLREFFDDPRGFVEAAIEG